MTQISGHDKRNLVFEIISARIHDESDERKHVVYNLQVRHLSGNDDLTPSIIERRYTSFLNLYNGLKKEYPDLMATVSFPKKVFMGNFNNELISVRSTGFESLLKHIATESKLRTSNSLVSFLQEPELIKAREFITIKDYASALPLLENIFILSNKVFTDRSVAVLLALCRLLGCMVLVPEVPNSKKWVDLTLHRFDGVSDSDLLVLYVPLIQTCIRLGHHSEDLERKLANFDRLGMNMNKTTCLLSAVENVEKKFLAI